MDITDAFKSENINAVDAALTEPEAAVLREFLTEYLSDFIAEIGSNPEDGRSGEDGAIEMAMHSFMAGATYRQADLDLEPDLEDALGKMIRELREAADIIEFFRGRPV